MLCSPSVTASIHVNEGGIFQEDKQYLVKERQTRISAIIQNTQNFNFYKDKFMQDIMHEQLYFHQ